MAGQQLGCSNFRNKLYQMFDFRKHLRKNICGRSLKGLGLLEFCFPALKNCLNYVKLTGFFLYKVIRSASVVWEWCKYEVSSIFPNGAFFWDKFKLLNAAIFSVSVLGGFAAGSFLNAHMQRNAGFCTYLHPIA